MIAPVEHDATANSDWKQRIVNRSTRTAQVSRGSCGRADLLHGDNWMKRYGSVIRVRPESLAAYKHYHAAVWPEVLDMIRKCNIRNYSIFLKDDLLFGYFEYHGLDYAADMAKMAADPKTQEWWAVMMPMQRPLETRAEGEWWANMVEVFHCD